MQGSRPSPPTTAPLGAAAPTVTTHVTPPVSPVAASSVLLSSAVLDDPTPSAAEVGTSPPSIATAAQEGVAALRQGANDYVVLPVLPTELEARINMQVALRRAVRIKAEASSSMQLLRSMLPGHVIRRLKAGQTYIAQFHEQVTIAFIDVVGFTDMSASWPSSKVAQMLNDLFASFDDICDRHGVYHVDTIGDG
ncbi:hypothetical protein DUNSADRAFT_12008 [Dunaliella salina]|uniref:Guanylate cyclase domain-containing protein n=1 Tax=Dunaliella salina TaxID=3046 RepID=A0ABQ7GC33_DUNSA|nr:hypothetical protein DUNSADRAFT_12008 [Dunaliella salina]|eukprot:KAF5832169.1 hypothetical protein DUNSADRAFT_12008 [Dunaliella salina]